MDGHGQRAGPTLQCFAIGTARWVSEGSTDFRGSRDRLVLQGLVVYHDPPSPQQWLWHPIRSKEQHWLKPFYLPFDNSDSYRKLQFWIGKSSSQIGNVRSKLQHITGECAIAAWHQHQPVIPESPCVSFSCAASFKPSAFSTRLCPVDC